ncbi:MAG: hypothetical protein ACIAQ0_09155 [Phycisphaerales bacterium JB058]
MAKKQRMSKAEQEAAAAYERFEKWSSKHEGHSLKDPVLGKVVWSGGVWTMQKTVPLLGKRAVVRIDEDLIPADHNLSGLPKPVGSWAGKAWEKFIEDCPPERRDEVFETLHKETVRLANQWLKGPMLENFPEGAEHIKKYRDSAAVLKKSLKLDDVSLYKGDKKPFVSMHFETEFAEGYGLKLFYVVGRKKLVATFGNQLSPD